jgi:hypothetical protein
MTTKTLSFDPAIKQTDNGGLIIEYTADGALSLGSHIAVLAHASAGAMTLAVPTAKQDGMTIPLVKASDYEHTITAAAANVIVDSYSGNAGNRLTLTSALGQPATLTAYNGKWYTNTSGGGSISDV